ncbi:MAG: heme ABC transporter permease [Rhodospirillaceae bacterium]|jgi:heme exporter protein C|nr:heme ABC transporter permease [Rhodospirillaceae bacterium]
MHALANPTRFLKLAATIQPWAAGLCILCFLFGLPIALLFSPPDYQQGDTVRIMYIHVPAAWMGLFCYGVMAAGSASYLIWRHPVANMIAKSSAPIGAMFTALCLLTGMLWGQPMWGTPWVWDARLTSMLVLFFLYLGYIALGGAFDSPEQGDKAAAILALVGSVNLPIIKFSVDWWNSLHQPSIFSMAGISVDAAMLPPLFLMVGAFQLYYVVVVLMSVRAQVLTAKIRAAKLMRTT